MLFLPFEQRMTRDLQQWREKRLARRGKGDSASSEAAVGSNASASAASLLQDLPSGPSNAVVRFACDPDTAGSLNSQVTLARSAWKVLHMSQLAA